MGFRLKLIAIICLSASLFGDQKVTNQEDTLNQIITKLKKKDHIVEADLISNDSVSAKVNNVFEKQDGEDVTIYVAAYQDESEILHYPSVLQYTIKQKQWKIIGKKEKNLPTATNKLPQKTNSDEEQE